VIYLAGDDNDVNEGDLSRNNRKMNWRIFGHSWHYFNTVKWTL